MAGWSYGDPKAMVAYYISSDGLTWARLDKEVFPLAVGKSDYGQLAPDLVRMTSQWYTYYGQASASDWTHNRIGVAISGDYSRTINSLPTAEMGLNLKCQDDFDDVRFTTSDGATLLSHYMYNLTSGMNATGMVRFNTVGTSATSYYLYHGNDSATSASTTATYTKYSDMETGTNGNSVDGLEGWTIGLGVAVVSTTHAYNGTKSMKIPGAAAASMVTQSLAPSSDYEVRVRFWKNNASHDAYPIIWGNGTKRLVLLVDAAENLLYFNGSTFIDTTKNITADAWNEIVVNNMNFTAGTFDVYLNGTLAKSATPMGSSTAYNNIVGFQYEDTTVGDDVYFDYFYVKKWNSTAPVWVTFGSDNSSYKVMSVTRLNFAKIMGVLETGIAKLMGIN